jgi:hypothetical protein
VRGGDKRQPHPHEVTLLVELGAHSAQLLQDGACFVGGNSKTRGDLLKREWTTLFQQETHQLESGTHQHRIYRSKQIGCAFGAFFQVGVEHFLYSFLVDAVP